MQLFDFAPDALPLPADPERVETGWSRFADAVRGTPELEAFAAQLKNDPAGAKLAASIFGNSPFLTSCWMIDPQFTKDLLEHGPGAMRAAALAATRGSGVVMDEPALMTHLRTQKRRIALTAAIGDISGTWGLFDVTTALSHFADAAVSAACANQLKTLERRGKIRLKDPDDPERGSGLVVLGMGKLGGRELNYSSDIDLIILFDPDRIDTDDEHDLQHNFVRLARGVVRILDERTAGGYVFRTDLRLRPDPGSTPLAITTQAAEIYYESIGQNWERAAMIKARAIAGDKDAGAAFLKHLKPFVWRKNLDFVTIQDIQSIKRQINAHKGGHDIKLRGHNVKLGRGGIREIEFYAQTQQLIWGGRQRELRVIPTIEALNALVEAGHDTAKNAHTLIQAYKFLRKVEHRLQMVADEQTHTLPEDEGELAAIAAFTGYADLDAFAKDLLATLSKVERLYADLFPESAELSADSENGGNLVFTGGESDPETLKTLSEMGFKNPDAVDVTVRGWHHARYRATRSTKSRAILTELMPAILKAMANAADPDVALMRFDEFLSKLPAGVQLFAMFQANPQMLDLIAEVLGTAPRMAEHLSRKAGILDGVLTPGFLDHPPSAKEMRADLDHVLQDASCLEDVLDLSRRWAKDRKFQIGVQVLKGIICERESQRALTDVAETLLNALQPRVEDDFALRHGRVPGGAICIIAYGKLGGREKTPTSDMDLTFVYDAPDDAAQSDGEKPLGVSQYYARLSQRLINALTAPTAEGMLYEVDMRLRPSGNAGPVATSLDAFRAYQADNAWTWEHMALTRARTVTGPGDLRTRIEGIIRDTLTRPRDADKLVVDVADMRARMDQERHTDIPWQIKDFRGGLVDVEFIAQYLQLRHGHDHPEILAPTTRVALENIARAGLLDRDATDLLLDSLDVWHGLQGLLRLTVTADLGRDGGYVFPASLQRKICQIMATDGCEAAKARIADTAAQVLDIFRRLIDEPADRLRPHVKTDLA
ncbi:MAG: bifunctional [glutamine synthetase] adenylyltransferase/[glutamine synthetase]-adenylyl-L-tyrosine phosphorylase [Alphaproteobacteria bacterium]|nr:bifunctional [glutamine synthetase] adenylyltransferase/[glutamine synthetase]-adenylyl-L-tyrosine phosphorylase [Alphaproteobacteria bacterium]